MTRVEVCHYVTLVKRLPPDLVALVETEKAPHRLRLLCLRHLLRIARLGSAEIQRSSFRRLLDSIPSGAVMTASPYPIPAERNLCS